MQVLVIATYPNVQHIHVNITILRNISLTKVVVFFLPCFHMQSLKSGLFLHAHLQSHCGHLKVLNRYMWLVATLLHSTTLEYSRYESSTIYLSIPLLMDLVLNGAAVSILLQVSWCCKVFFTWFLCPRKIHIAIFLLVLPISGLALLKQLS